VNDAGTLRAAPIETGRLLLEPLREEHAREMLSVLADPALYEHTGGAPPTVGELEQRYARQVRGRSPDGRQMWLNWVLRRRDPARAVGFVQVTLDERGAELAWLVTPAEQGAGLATEAAGAVAQWLRDQGVRRLSAHIHPDNGASAAVARRLGMTPTAETKDGELRWVAPPA
jgi:RimJ/RimL family protein N-acetyltransferase